MLRYNQLSFKEKVRRAVRDAWATMSESRPEELRQMPSYVKLTLANDPWREVREKLYWQELERGSGEQEAWKAAVKRLLEMNNLSTDIADAILWTETITS